MNLCQDAYGNWDASNADFFQLLGTFDPRVLFIIDFPDRRNSVPNMVAGNPSNVEQGCVQARTSVYHSWYQNWVATVKRTAAQYRAFVFDTFDLSCGPTLCPCIVDKVLLYWDSNHVTRAWIEYVSPIVLTELAMDFFKPLVAAQTAPLDVGVVVWTPAPMPRAGH